MSDAQIFSLALALGAVCVCACIVLAIFELAVTAYAVRRSHDERSLGRAGYLLQRSQTLSNPLILGFFGSLAIVMFVFPERLEAFSSGRSWIYAVLGVVIVISGVVQTALGRWLKRRLSRELEGKGHG